VQTIRALLFVTTVVVATVVFAMIGVDLHAMRPIPSTAVTTVAADEGAPEGEGAVRKPSSHTILLPAALDMPNTSWSGQGEAKGAPVHAAPRNPVPTMRSPRAVNDLRVFLLNMARAEWDHSSLGIHVNPTGVLWIDDLVKSDR
jgi:hypothetical protein